MVGHGLSVDRRDLGHSRRAARPREPQRDLDPGESYTLTLDTLMPPATPGQYRVIVRTDIFNQVYEREFDVNNKTASAETMSVTVDELLLGVPHATTFRPARSGCSRSPCPTTRRCA